MKSRVAVVVAWRSPREGECATISKGSSRKHELLFELVELRRAVSQSMVVRDVVEELLGIERSAEEESKVSVRRLDDVCNEVDSFSTVERLLIREPVLDTLRKDDCRPEGLRDTREKGRVDVELLPCNSGDGAVFLRERSNGVVRPTVTRRGEVV